jgi:hypothetical protein
MSLNRPDLVHDKRSGEPEAGVAQVSLKKEIRAIRCTITIEKAGSPRELLQVIGEEAAC